MALQFKTYESSSTLEDLGTIEEILGKDGAIRFSSDRNLNSSKRVTLILQRKNGESVAVPCSSAVSNVVRQAIADGTDEDDILAALVTLSLLESEDGRIFISPKGSGDGTPKKDSFKVSDLKKLKKSYESLAV